jgi:NTP pyrophosphatase (non-canonical NTP hydrolase)
MPGWPVGGRLNPADFDGGRAFICERFPAMPDDTTTVAALREAMRRFVAERNWEVFHSPKNLSMGAAIEAAELMEHFQWLDNDASRQVVHDAAKMGEIADELADVACYLFAFCNTLGIDLSEAVLAKLGKNAVKYPAEQYRGRYRIDE